MRLIRSYRAPHTGVTNLVLEIESTAIGLLITRDTQAKSDSLTIP
jgi:hypothetical protein